MNIFKKASQLRKQHPRKYSNYQDYVSWAKRELQGKGSAKKPSRSAPKKRAPKPSRSAAISGTGKLTIAQMRARIKSQLEEQLAWGLLARDQAKNKTDRKKRSKKVTEIRGQLNRLK